MGSYGIEVVWDQDDNDRRRNTNNSSNGNGNGNGNSRGGLGRDTRKPASSSGGGGGRRRSSSRNAGGSSRNARKTTTTTTTAAPPPSTSTYEAFDQNAIRHIVETNNNTNRGSGSGSGSGRYYSNSIRNKQHQQQQQPAQAQAAPVPTSSSSSSVSPSNRRKSSGSPQRQSQRQPQPQSQQQQQQQQQRHFNASVSVSTPTSAAGAHVYEEGWATFDDDNNNAFGNFSSNGSGNNNSGSQQQDHIIHYSLRDHHLHSGHSWADTSTIASSHHQQESTDGTAPPTPESSFMTCFPVVNWNASNGDRINDYDDDDDDDDEYQQRHEASDAGAAAKSKGRGGWFSSFKSSSGAPLASAADNKKERRSSAPQQVARSSRSTDLDEFPDDEVDPRPPRVVDTKKENEKKSKTVAVPVVASRKEKEKKSKTVVVPVAAKAKKEKQKQKQKPIGKNMRRSSSSGGDDKKSKNSTSKQKVVIVDKKGLVPGGLGKDEDEKRRYRRRMCFLFIAGCLVMGLVWFLVYYLTTGKEKWSMGRSQSAAGGVTSSPTVSPAPTISFAPTGTPSASPTKNPTATPVTGVPTNQPTMSPTNEPTNKPTPAPTRATFPPTPAPTTKPTPAPTSLSEVTDPQILVDLAAKELRQLIEDDPKIGPKFVRLGFHDCVGFCDGCVDMSFFDNFGLEVPIEALEPITAKYERLDLGFTRADIWALSALVAADFHQEQNEEFVESDRVNFQMQFIGRQNCEDRFNNRCFGEDGVTQRECSATLGPFHHLPMADITTHDLFAFFAEEFGFGDRETVALMGAHTLGALARENSGIDAPNGWVRDNNLLDNEYYFELVGADGDPNAPLEDWIELAPPWLRVKEDNSDNPPFSDKTLWEAFPPNTTDPTQVERIVMLNADIALVRELTDENMDEQGRVSCAFTNVVGGGAVPRCPHAERSIGFAAEYLFDNELWLNDFMRVYHRMLNHGCTDGIFCNGGLCKCNL